MAEVAAEVVVGRAAAGTAGLPPPRHAPPPPRAASPRQAGTGRARLWPANFQQGWPQQRASTMHVLGYILIQSHACRRLLLTASLPLRPAGGLASPLLAAAASTSAQTMRIRQISHEAQRNDSVGEKVSHWKGLFREKGERCRRHGAGLGGHGAWDGGRERAGQVCRCKRLLIWPAELRYPERSPSHPASHAPPRRPVTCSVQI